MTARETFASWSLLCTGGAMNLLRVGDIAYSWDFHPREQKNGALLGRVYAQERGKVPTDIGAYKVAPDGAVELMPEPLRDILKAAPPPVVEPPQEEVDDSEGDAAQPEAPLFHNDEEGGHHATQQQ